MPRLMRLVCQISQGRFEEPVRPCLCMNPRKLRLFVHLFKRDFQLRCAMKKNMLTCIFVNYTLLGLLFNLILSRVPFQIYIFVMHNWQQVVSLSLDTINEEG